MGIGITPEGYLAVSDRYNHCIRLYQYKNEQDCYDCIEMDGKCPKCRDHQVNISPYHMDHIFNHKTFFSTWIKVGKVVVNKLHVWTFVKSEPVLCESEIKSAKNLSKLVVPNLLSKLLSKFSARAFALLFLYRIVNRLLPNFLLSVWYFSTVLLTHGTNSPTSVAISVLVFLPVNLDFI